MKYLIIDKRQRVEVATMGEIPTGSARLVEELDKKNIPHDFAYNDEIEFLFHNGSTVIKVAGHDVTEYSNIILRGHSLGDEREYQYKRFIIDYVDQYNRDNPEKKVIIQNSKAIKNLPYYNKIAFAMLCSKNNLPYFNTYFHTNGEYLKDRDMLKEYPLIIKEYSGMNRTEMIEGKEKIKKNVFKLEKDEDYKQENLDGQDLSHFFIQEFSDAGEDYRIFVKLGKVIAGWKRKAVNGFMTVSKGEYEMYNTPNEEITEIAEKMASVLEADFMAVDFMYMNGKACIQEISFHPGYKAYETKIEGEPVNIAEAIVTAF
jgi:glutathione synthase/RimK-type ligase-like ATP-grasp enzyme